MKIFYSIREFFWPLLEKLEEHKQSELKIDNNDQNSELYLELSLRYYDNEEKRKNNVESKSIVFIGTMSFTIAVMLFFIKEILFSNIYNNLFSLISIFILIIVVIYFCRAVWFSIKALERQSYHSLSEQDFLNIKNNLSTRIAENLIKKIKINSKVINIKVDYMTMAQEYFKRAIGTIMFFCIILLFYIIINQKKINLLYYIKKINKFILTTNFNYWFVITISVFILIIFILVIILFFKIRKIEKNKII